MQRMLQVFEELLPCGQDNGISFLSVMSRSRWSTSHGVADV